MRRGARACSWSPSKSTSCASRCAWRIAEFDDRPHNRAYSCPDDPSAYFEDQLLSHAPCLDQIQSLARGLERQHADVARGDRAVVDVACELLEIGVVLAHDELDRSDRSMLRRFDRANRRDQHAAFADKVDRADQGLPADEI